MKNSILTLNLIIILALTAPFIGCSKANNKASQTIQGGQDSGGGDTTVSTIQDVEFYYNRAVPILPKVFVTFFHKNTIEKFIDLEKKELLYEAEKKILSIASKQNVSVPENADTDQIYFANLKAGIAHLIESSTITIKKDAVCSAVDNMHATASIKEFRLGSPICISFLKLKRLSKSSLEKEIIGLVFHEYMHALGYKESQAIVLQKMLLQNFDRMFPRGMKTVDRKKTSFFVSFFNDKFELNYTANSFEKLFTNLDAYQRAQDYKNYDSKTETWLNTLTNQREHIPYKDSDWERECARIRLTGHQIKYLQNMDIETWSRLGPQLVDANIITDEEIDTHLENIDNMRIEIHKSLFVFLNSCRFKSFTNDIKNTPDGVVFDFNKFITAPALSPNDLKAQGKIFARDIRRYLELIESTQVYTNKYN